MGGPGVGLASLVTPGNGMRKEGRRPLMTVPAGHAIKTRTFRTPLKRAGSAPRTPSPRRGPPNANPVNQVIGENHSCRTACLARRIHFLTKPLAPAQPVNWTVCRSLAQSLALPVLLQRSDQQGKQLAALAIETFSRAPIHLVCVSPAAHLHSPQGREKHFPKNATAWPGPHGLFLHRVQQQQQQSGRVFRKWLNCCAFAARRGTLKMSQGMGPASCLGKVTQ